MDKSRVSLPLVSNLYTVDTFRFIFSPVNTLKTFNKVHSIRNINHINILVKIFNSLIKTISRNRPYFSPFFSYLFFSTFLGFSLQCSPDFLCFFFFKFPSSFPTFILSFFQSIDLLPKNRELETPFVISISITMRWSLHGDLDADLIDFGLRTDSYFDLLLNLMTDSHDDCLSWHSFECLYGYNGYNHRLVVYK